MSNNTNWSIDNAHSEIAFKVKHMMISTVTGHFEDFQATAKTDGDNFNNADFQFTAKTASINTKNEDRDTHLKSDDFFNAEKYPELKFVSKSFDGEKLIGDLTIRDVTKEVVLDADFNGIAVDPYGQTKAGFEISGQLNRKDFNLTWSAVTEAGSIVVSDKVKLVVDVQFIKQS
ncbi:YceI family protein [Hwangdonia lutea]|uniref:YceI family protein n=1 Tax=Hwangdonia lutea TaxID=3075823 RepID=A0AA97HQR8_9FLAO|nr:YceI family protein [Hwangdonia sp. SCSIO 19198]WOD42678.1 YceI family protein [Hwangdonia sp. SCSIO 19198]